MIRYLPFIIVILVGLLALGSGAWLYRSKKRANATPTIAKIETETPGQSVHCLGPGNAQVTLEEFGDFQCPPCGKLAEPLNQLQKEFNLRVIFREFPLPMHQHAREAAVTAEAAGEQGRFWAMHDLLYREQPVWSKAGDARPLFNAYAGMLGLDLNRFKKDMDSEDVKQRVTIDQRRGAVIGVKNTPTIFLNDRAVSPNPSDLRAEITKELKTAQPSS